jgi:hypothetical protein
MPGDVLEVRVEAIDLAVDYGFNRQRPYSGTSADNLAVARAAFDTAVSLWPGSAIELRQKARVIAHSEAK